MSSSAGKGKMLGHSTWHPQPATSDDARAQVRHLREVNDSPERARRAVRKKSASFNMKGMLQSVSTHSFTRRTTPGGVAPDSKKIPSVDTKGWFLEKQGKLDQAELMYSRHCVRAQKQHGKESLPVADNLDRLVHLLHKEGKLEEAEPLSRRALDIRRKSLGEENEEVATAMINLGRVLEEKGQYSDALIYLKKGLTIREKILEEGHPDTVSALAWIGDIFSKQEWYEEALKIAKKVLKAHEAKLGPDDIKVASSLNNVAGLMATIGSPKEALPLFARSHEIYAKHLGENHPHAVATQLWVQQLSEPAPAPPRARRASLSDMSFASRDLMSPPPPLVEGRGGEEDEEGSQPSAEHQPATF